MKKASPLTLNNSQLLLKRLILTAALLAPALSPALAGSQTEWWKIEQDVARSLLKHNTDQTLRELSARAEKGDAQSLLSELDICLRAGRESQAASALEKLSAARPKPDKSVLSYAADFLIGREEWDLSRRFLEIFPQAEPGWGYVFVKHWAQQSKPATIDSWLASRQKANFKYWMSERLRLAAQSGTADALLTELSDAVLKHGTDVEKAQYYVEALQQTARKKDISWMTEACKPRLSWDTFRFGQAIESYSPSTASVFFQRSLSMPYTAQDQKLLDDYMRTHSQALISGNQNWQKQLRGWTRQELAQCYQRCGQSSKAQPLIEQLSAQYPDGLPLYGLSQLSGQVQAGSGARVIEKRLKVAEPGNKNSSEYWLTRAQYYVGRKEERQATEAFEKSIQVAPTAQADEMWQRSRAVSDYARYESGLKGKEAAMKILRREFDTCPPGSEYASRLVSDMVWYEDNNSGFLRGDDEVLWSYLSAHQTWTVRERDLLQKMAHNSLSTRESFFQRAELLARDNASRAAFLGEVLQRNQCAARAVPQLRYAVSHLSEKQELEVEMARSNLFSACLEAGLWRQAEELLPTMIAHLDPDSLTSMLKGLAVAAARCGDKKDALRIWSKKDRLDRSDISSLAELSRYGMKPALIEYYRQMAWQDKNSSVPAAALAQLKQ